MATATSQAEGDSSRRAGPPKGAAADVSGVEITGAEESGAAGADVVGWPGTELEGDPPADDGDEPAVTVGPLPRVVGGAVDAGPTARATSMRP
jgi:hypothetical protein